MSELVAKLLGLVVAIGLAGIILLAATGRLIPDPLTIIATSALSGLLGLLARPALDAPKRRRRPPAGADAPQHLAAD